MKKFLSIVLVIISCIAVVWLVSATSGDQFKEENEGREVFIEWEKVNVREGHSTTKKVLCSLTEGSLVTLTGNYFEYFGGDGEPTEHWTEIQLSDGTIGWLVTTSIKWI
ncbi:MAG: hypothetical protein IJB90_00680 [Clostridia bacterium]|nr:hypothetical protein [Clostridia bacterium]